jgi:hypothetical protein
MTIFDNDIELTRLNDNLYRGSVTNNWMINGNPNGGYLMAMILRALEMQGTRKTTMPIITANFISRCSRGDIGLKVEKISESGYFERYEVQISQAKSERVRALVTFTSDTPVDDLCRYESGPPVVSELSLCTPMPHIPGLTIYDNVDARFDPECSGLFGGTLQDKSEFKGWIRLKEARPYDYASLILLAVAFPPPVFNSQGLIAWVPTIEFSGNIKTLPASPWLKCIFRTRFITNGLLEEDGELWDEEERLIAVSRQYAMFKRNTL